MARKKILICASDPGGATYLIPVLHELVRHPDFCLEMLVYGEALSLFKEEGFHVLDVNRELEAFSSLQALFESIAPDLLLGATSVNEFNWERKFVQLANMLGVPSVSVIDFWSNFLMRFRLDENELVMPSKIAVIDQSMKESIQASGVDDAILSVVGHPAYELIANKKGGRQESNDEGDVLRILFVSQPIAKFHLQEYGDENHLGFNEKSVFKDLVLASGKFAAERGVAVEISVLLHPRNSDEIQLPYMGIGVHAVQIKNANRYCAIAEMNLVLGMYSSFLYEAHLLGANAVSYMPESRQDNLPYEEGSPVSQIRQITKLEDLFQSLQESDLELIDKQPSSFMNQFEHSTQRLVNLCCDLTNV
ncbi:MAG: hypothetical protein ACRBEE_07335 [Arenicella sp.]